MELVRVCRELEAVFPLKFAQTYEPLSFIFPAVNKEAGINYRKIYESKFLDCYNGLMIKGAKIVNSAYCVVFPNPDILQKLLTRCRPGDFIFTHHCCGYDDKLGFLPIPAELAEEIKVNQVSLYSLHTPFDVNCPWSTSVQLAKVVGISVEGEFAVVLDKPSGVYGKPPVGDLTSLAGIVRRQIGAGEVTVITNRKNQNISRVAVIAGGGGYANLVNDAHRYECDTYLTGTVVENIEIEAVQDANMRFRKKAEELGINIIGGGHYYTEKVALEGMVDFFGGLGLQAEFVPQSAQTEVAG